MTRAIIRDDRPTEVTLQLNERIMLLAACA